MGDFVSVENEGVMGCGRVQAKGVPLCVDLDGTLTPSDTLVESFLVLFKHAPWVVFLLPFWLLRGRAFLKKEIANRSAFDLSDLPWNSDLLALLREEKKRGRSLILVTAADQAVASALRGKIYPDLFEEAIGSDGSKNLKGEEKGAHLVWRFGKKGFDYVGNSRDDLPVWREARNAWVVSGPELQSRARGIAQVERVIPVPLVGWRDWARALRIHQWSKNMLLFVPLLGAHQWNDLSSVVTVLIAFVTFCLGASSVYMLNDLLDVGADRKHSTKRFRPFASGRLPLVVGIVGFGVLLGLAGALCLLSNWQFTAAFFGYYGVTLVYSLKLKQVPVLDVFVLAGLYGVRVLAGGLAIHVPVSEWLLLFSMFFFLSLALVKRYTEIDALLCPKGVLERGYEKGDAVLVGSMGVCSGYLSVLILALYVSHSSIVDLYSSPQVLWLLCPLILYWISRVWLLTHRGDMHDDPISFALKDRQSWVILLMLLAIGFAAVPR